MICHNLSDLVILVSWPGPGWRRTSPEYFRISSSARFFLSPAFLKYLHRFIKILIYFTEICLSPWFSLSKVDHVKIGHLLTGVLGVSRHLAASVSCLNFLKSTNQHTSPWTACSCRRCHWNLAWTSWTWCCRGWGWGWSWSSRKLRRPWTTHAVPGLSDIRPRLAGWCLWPAGEEGSSPRTKWPQRTSTSGCGKAASRWRKPPPRPLRWGRNRWNTAT